MSVCLLNYRVDGTTFWNQFFIAALRDAAGNVTNYVGVQCKVSDQYAANVCRRQDEADRMMMAEKEEGDEDEEEGGGGVEMMQEDGKDPRGLALHQQQQPQQQQLQQQVVAAPQDQHHHQSVIVKAEEATTAPPTEPSPSVPPPTAIEIKTEGGAVGGQLPPQSSAVANPNTPFLIIVSRRPQDPPFPLSQHTLPDHRVRRPQDAPRVVTVAAFSDC